MSNEQDETRHYFPLGCGILLLLSSYALVIVGGREAFRQAGPLILITILLFGGIYMIYLGFKIKRVASTGLSVFEKTPSTITLGLNEPAEEARSGSYVSSSLAILENAHLTSNIGGNDLDELNVEIDAALDSVAAKGHSGTELLVRRLYLNMKVVGFNLHVHFGGDSAWNEWLKKRAIVRSLGRNRAESAVPRLVELLEVSSSDSQFYDILQPTLAEALGEIGDRRAIEPLRKAVRNPNTYQKTVRAIGGALEKLEGQTSANPEFILAKADELYKSGRSLEVLQTLERISGEIFDSLIADHKYYVWFLRGESNKKLGDKTKAIECYQTSLKYFDDSPDLAMSYRRLGELKLD